ncbi:MAG: hypothetical protein DLM55_00590 [Acidimicrobiales bacterium]|nr:MAG: hypothetical protein DLM55_00590 [Acidimicrobiales bacterium]
MTQPAHNYESAEFDLAAPIERAIEEAEHGKVIYLHSRQQQKVVIMPPELAAAALEALDEAEVLRVIEERQNEERIPWDQVKAELRELEAKGL